ncbi:MAG: hypothetical protein K9H64_07175 [Bacteroidales bacterium]|nr:hypothetical protein [Bacteroidales bacterium]MCF8455558.1 hypothetical protein [Bacteroidales bacterium]
MRYFLILNPGSKGGKSRKSFERIFDAFKKADLAFDYKMTESLDDAYTFSVEANKMGYDVIVAVGGDGTINKVINGFFDSQGNRISKSKMAVIYTGTSPDFCKSYNIPTNTDEAINVIIDNFSRKIYLGKLVCNTRIQEDSIVVPQFDAIKTTYFACCANIGLGASVARKANGGIRKYLGDTLGTFIALLSSVFAYKASDFQVMVDGKKQRLEKLYNMSVGRTTFIASGIKVSNDINLSEKGFYFLVVKKLSIFNLPSIIKKIYSGKPFKNSEVISLDYCQDLQVLHNSVNPEVELDGDPVGYLPCRIESSGDVLDLIVTFFIGKK